MRKFSAQGSTAPPGKFQGNFQRLLLRFETNNSCGRDKPISPGVVQKSLQHSK
jgi:hypothetical protein